MRGCNWEIGTGRGEGIPDERRALGPQIQLNILRDVVVGDVVLRLRFLFKTWRLEVAVDANPCRPVYFHVSEGRANFEPHQRRAITAALRVTTLL